MIDSLNKTDGKATLMIGSSFIPVQINTIDVVAGQHTKFEGYVISAHDCFGSRRVTRVKEPVRPASKPIYNPFAIKDVIFNDPATIVLWVDGTKTVVKCQDGDVYSKDVGLALCFAKKALGNKGNFNEVFKKWIPEEGFEPVDDIDDLTIGARHSAAEFLANLWSTMPTGKI